MGREQRLLTAALTATVAAAGAYTAAVVAAPRLGVMFQGSALRAVIEVSGFFLLCFAALVLGIVRDDDMQVVRGAFVSGLVILAATNAVFGVATSVGAYRLAGDVAYYPRLLGRTAAGGLFALSASGRLRTAISRLLVGSLGVVAALDALAVALEPRLLDLVALGPGPGGLTRVEVTEPLLHGALQSLPALLFLLGAGLAGRSFLRSGSPLFLGLCAALVLQSVTQVHEILYPASLGPVVTSADVLRIASFVLLSAGALAEVRRSYTSQSATVRTQIDDLRAHDALARDLADLMGREQDFQAIVSHELATPTATIRAFAHVADNALDRDAPPAAREAIRGIETEARRLAELVARIDELRHLELTEFRCDLRPALLRPLLEEATSFARGLPGAPPTTLRCEEGLRVAVDPVRFGQAIRNVLSNAARYSPSNARITIDAEATPTGLVRVAVTDEGPGVPSDERTKVLGRYARGSGGPRTEGVGLGLYIASKITQAHGGRLRIEDPLDPHARGARVVIDLRPA